MNLDWILKALWLQEELTDEQVAFLEYFDWKLPVGDHDCVQNKICKRIEEEFDGYVKKNPPPAPFDYTVLKTSMEYTKSQYALIAELYEEYTQKVQEFMVESYYKRMDQDDAIVGKALLLRKFQTAL